MKIFTCTINVAPYSKSNNTMRGRGKRLYVPEKYKVWDAQVQAAVSGAMLEQGFTIFDGALELRIDGFYGTKRTVDAPNLPKSICDALNGVLYYDDRQIITCITTKDYDKLNPRMELTLKRVADDHPLVNIKNLIG